MKTKLLQSMTKIRPALVLAALLFPLSSWAQNIIYDAPYPQTENTIIRHYKDSIEIGCDVIGSVSVFSYNNRNTLTVRQFSMPSNIAVFDFEILNDTVYFCGGDNTGNGQAVFGWFSIHHIFFGVDYIYLRHPDMSSDNIHVFRFLEVKEIASTIHIYMTGYANYSYTKDDPKHPNFHGILAEAWRTTSGIWKFQYTVDSTHLFEYVDIALTDNYAVVASSRHVDNRAYNHCIISYVLPTASTADNTIFDLAPHISSNLIFVYPQETDTSIFSWKRGSGDSYRITKMENDGFSTVIRAKSHSLNDTFHVVSIYDHPLTLPIRRFCFFNGAAQRFFGIGYNPVCKTLYYVQDYPERYFYSSPFPYYHLRIHSALELTWFDIDNVDGTPYGILSGWGDHNERKLWLFDENQDNCVRYDDVPIRDLLKEQSPYLLKQPIKNSNLSSDNIIMKSSDGTMSVICRP